MAFKSLIIMPCAGFGTRMALLPNQSKELLPDPYNSNKPLIDWHLDLLKDYHKVVITREEKEDLIDHLYTDPETDVYVQLTQPTKEWPSSVLETKTHWQKTNILILPDTRYQPTDIVSKIDKELENNDIVFAIHKVDDVTKWGQIVTDSYKKVMGTIEKPIINSDLPKSGSAWGLIGFRNNVGEKLFQAYLDKVYFDLTPYKTSVIVLDKFCDITRTGKIESY